MHFNEGDLVTGAGFGAGRYLGASQLEIGTIVSSCHKILDEKSKAVYYIPISGQVDLRKLPSKQTMKKYLGLLQSTDIYELGLVDDNRYKFFKEKANAGSYRKLFEAFHDLYLLNYRKETTASEKKLITSLKEKIGEELSIIFSVEDVKASKMLEEAVAPLSQ